MNNFICRFCQHKTFGKNKKNALESFFWHIVSMHTGEYKQSCSDCVDTSKCTFNLDIPPPPKNTKGQLIGYICGKCNFTQISLENLKTHVINRHNDEQTEVYNINLAVTSKKMMNMYFKHIGVPEKEQPRVLRSARSNQSIAETSDEPIDNTDATDHHAEPAVETEQPELENENSGKNSPKSNLQSKITFENDDNVNKKLITANIDTTSNLVIKQEKVDGPENQEPSTVVSNKENEITESADITSGTTSTTTANDIFSYPHFKITYTETGSKEFVCCINGKDNHYKTSLLISMKKHVQIKHLENWDGYCFLCKVIVTPQGTHVFKDCLQHFLDKHIDDFPVLEKAKEPEKTVETPKPYINVRPLSELTTIKPRESVSNSDELPRIENVVSLGVTDPVPNYPASSSKEPQPPQQYKYEEAQAEVMSKKHHVVLETMKAEEKLVNIYKCAGRFCSFTTDSAEVALVHALTHQQIGGEGALRCAYCDFDCKGHPIDLVVHVFKHAASSFVCGFCFYRAATSQLVVNHISRLHKGQTIKVLRPTDITPPPQVQEDLMIPREIAVPYYVCAHEDDQVRCKFRTYTAGKFCDHLHKAHPNATSHKCDICNVQCSTVSDLVQHMKEHGFNLYQCIWCLYGADCERELLGHASAVHPDKQPQAYLRIITNKEGSSDYRVLPLASFNNHKVTTIKVTPNNANDNPVKEAERSIELEKLIGFTSQLAPSSSTIELKKDRQNDPVLPASPPPESLMLAEPAPEVPPPHATPPRVTAEMNNLSDQSTPVLKTEPIESTPVKDYSDEVVCLDSDDESNNPKQDVIDLSDDDVTSKKLDEEFKLLPTALLFQCSKCSLLFKGITGFKIHLSSCFGGIVMNVPCAHCPKKLANREELVEHYIKDHSSNSRYFCGVCDFKSISANLVKKHVKKVHKIDKMAVTSRYSADGNFNHVVENKSPIKERAAKRKNSLSSSSGPPTKTKRYGPQDIDLLPINPILDDLVYCSLCVFSTKVRLNMVRHLQFHAEQQPVPQTAPVNPVPHLETNEMHFDKMLNLASSSIVTRGPEKTTAPVVSLLIPVEDASKYPKYVPERQRLTCGAKDCAYISLDEAMLRCHWETLHSGSNDFHCVHCPPYQHLDKSKPLTASRIIGHLKMHDTTLYSCSICSFYHYKRQVIEKHLSDVHKNGQVMVVREEAGASNVQVSQPTTSAPTMDLKPWQCGLCNFKSMLRPEVVEHCAKNHQSKMQYKCTYCPFRTSTLDNVTKHQTNAHAGKTEDIFYYYYREGSIPDDADGIPRWVKQRQKSGLPEPEVKIEIPEPVSSKTPLSIPSIAPIEVDLNIVKKEVDANVITELSMEDLCKKYGDFCDTNGLKYKCPLCQIVTEVNKEDMQSHLYEELQYRKWGCIVCSYKAFHITGLQEHMTSEHRGQYQSANELPKDINIEKWVTGLLDHQTELIARYKENLTKQKIQVQPTPSVSRTQYGPVEATVIANIKEIEKAFGKIGIPSNTFFSCPKCAFKTKDEKVMRDHLESELSKIRWCCNKCTNKFQTYHEVQFHCKSVHDGQGARPVEATRDPAIREAWVTTVLQTQTAYIKKQIDPNVNCPEKPDREATDNSLLVVRYEENVSMPEARRKRSAPSGDSDDERLVINESPGQCTTPLKCPHCDFQSKSRKETVLIGHILRHYNLKPFNCPLCDLNGSRPIIIQHLLSKHLNTVLKPIPTRIPAGPPLLLNCSESKPKKSLNADDEIQKNVCLICEKMFTDVEMSTHAHDNITAEFAKKGDVVVKCCVCLVLRKDIVSIQEHHNLTHPDTPVNYAYFKLLHDSREIQCCEHCKLCFKFVMDLRRHHDVVHSSLTLKYKTVPYLLSVTLPHEYVNKTPIKRVAKKSTTKLPAQRIAKKSTTKLPLHIVPELIPYTFYGCKRDSLEKYSNVTTLMPFCNRMMPFTVNKLSEIIDIDPKVLVSDANMKQVRDTSDCK